MAAATASAGYASACGRSQGMQVVPMEEQPKYGVVVGVTEQPAPSGVVVGVVMEQPGASEGREGGRGSLEFLGRWNEN